MDFIGSGLAFPLHVDHRGGVALAHGDEDVRQAMAIILGTAPGERPMRPEFGCRLQEFVFDGVDAYTMGRLREAVLDALERWEPRVEVLDIKLDLSELQTGRLLLDIDYTLRTSNDVRNLVYPFYLVPAGVPE
jgi:phage baseplate assembly protein W